MNRDPSNAHANEDRPRPDLGNLDDHALRSMRKRGWTVQQIREAFERGQAFPTIDLTAGGESATRYVHPETGRSVIINDLSGRVIHLGGDGYLYDE